MNSGEKAICDLASVLKSARGYLRKSEFARRCGTNPTKLRAWTSGTMSPRLYDAANVLDALGYDLTITKRK